MNGEKEKFKTPNTALIFAGKIVSSFIFRLYQEFPKVVDFLVSDLEQRKNLSLIEKQMGDSASVHFKGQWTQSVEKPPTTEKEIIKKVIFSYIAAKKAQGKVSTPYLPSGGWTSVSNAHLSQFHKDVMNENYESVACYLRNFFRNEAISGLWSSPVNPFQEFCNRSGYFKLSAENQMKMHYLEWRKNLPYIDLKELDAPRVGNPFGYRFNDYLIIDPIFEYNFQAHYFNKLLSDIDFPVVLEIGGGFGGLAYNLLCRRSSMKYVGLDLPENLLIQTYYLSCIFPKARILVYQENDGPLTQDQLDDNDIVLLPNFELEKADPLIADLIVNVRSLSEMSYQTIVEYLAQIDRIGRLFFFHENIYKPRKDSRHGIPSSVFPNLKNFNQIYGNESRWFKYNRDSAYPCQENLFIRQGALSQCIC